MTEDRKIIDFDLPKPPDFDKVIYEEAGETPNVMTVDDLADYLQVSRKSIYVMAQAAEVPAVKVAGQWRFFKPAVDRWLWVLSQQDYKGPALTTGEFPSQAADQAAPRRNGDVGSIGPS
jgi:excisionase family DNA binding protein